MTDKARSAGAQPRCRGFSLFELIIAGLVVGLLTTLLLVRLQSYQREAQQVAVQHLVGTLRTALSVKNAQLHVAKKEQELQGIIDENPISWLIEAPG